MTKFNVNKLHVTGALIGNVMEFFDFIIYVYLSTYITQNFFPHENPFVAKILMFSVFASGYLTRPLGALVFGNIGDKFGRKIALIYSIVLITLATAGIGLLPTYSTLGILAPLLLVFCRLLQGFAVSGEQAGAAVYLAESTSKNKKGFISSLVLASTCVGSLLGASLCLALATYLTQAQMQAFGWRIPFLLSIILGVVSFVIRLQGIESHEFKKMQLEKRLSKAPVKDVFKQHSLSLFLMVFVVTTLSVPIYMYTTYIPSYLLDSLEIGFHKGLIFSTLALFFISLLLPFVGKMADKLGTEKTLKIGMTLCALLGYPIFALIAHKSYFSIASGMMVMGILVALTGAPMYAVVMNVFPTQLRYTASAFVFNMSMSIFGGTVPIVSITLIEVFKDEACPGIYVALVGLAGILAFCFHQSKNLLLGHISQTPVPANSK